MSLKQGSVDIKEKYLIARARPKARQPFLDEINLAEYEPYVSRIKYLTPESLMHEITDSSGGAVSASLNPLQGIFGIKKIRSSILVTSNLFNIENENDFLGILLHHEGDHARQKFKRGRIRRKNRKLMEHLAFLNQLKHLTDMEYSDGYVQSVYSGIVRTL
jgi:hypothetical protein